MEDSAPAVQPTQRAESRIIGYAGRKQRNQQNEIPGSYHLDNELTLHEFQTLAEFTFGLPRHVLTFTNKRLIVEQRLRLLGVCGKSLLRTVHYR